MRVLWVTNRPVLNNRKLGSGTWLDAMLDLLIKEKDVELFIVALGNSKNKVCHESVNGITQYVIPFRKNVYKQYAYADSRSINEWKEIIADIKPEVITLWGTEYSHGLAALKVSDGIPTVVFLQGIMRAISRYCMGNVSYFDIKKITSFRDITKRDSIICRQKEYMKSAYTEEMIISQAKNVIVDNRWAESYCKAIYPQCKTFWCHLPVKAIFEEKRWESNCDRVHTIMCTACGSSPLKGLHTLLNALAIVKKKYNDIVLKIPGMSNPDSVGMKGRILQNGYTRYINRLIKRLDLLDNVVFLGRISSDRMAEELSCSDVYVVPSSIENHSISLREAMMVGVPCIASYVGSIPEVLRNGENGLLFASGDFECLAAHLISLLDDKEYAQRIGDQGRTDIKQFYSRTINDSLYDIYKKLI